MRIYAASDEDQQHTTLDHAIFRSVAYTEIVTVAVAGEAWDEAVALLSGMADDSVAASPELYEAWGTNDDGAEWRVRLSREVAS